MLVCNFRVLNVKTILLRGLTLLFIYNCVPTPSEFLYGFDVGHLIVFHSIFPHHFVEMWSAYFMCLERSLDIFIY